MKHVTKLECAEAPPAHAPEGATGRPISKRLRLRRPGDIAAGVTVAFLCAGAVWILLTDILMYQLVSDPLVIARLETAKGWGFVAACALLLYVSVKSSVTPLARSEATIRAVVDSIADGVLLLRSDGTIAGVNPAAARMLGVGAPEELVGMGPEEFSRRYHVSLPNGRLIPPERFVSQRAVHGEAPPPYQVWLYPPGKPPLVLISTGAPVRIKGNEQVELAVSVMHDITERVNAEHMRDQFFSGAAHALKTPVSVVKAHAQLWAARSSLAIDRSAAEAIQRQCGKIDRLTQNMIALVRLRSGSLRLHPETVDCAALVSAAVHEMRGASAEQAIALALSAQPEVFVDRERTALVLRNLIELALQRSEVRSEITVALDEVDTRARVRVAYEPHATGGSGHASRAEDDGLQVETHVVAALVEAANGSFHEEHSEEGRCAYRVELPTTHAAGNPA